MKLMWLWVIIGMVFASAVIVIIFIYINKCISRRGKHRLSHLQHGPRLSLHSNKYQEYDHGTPALPPRTQFLLEEAQSYENLAESPAPDHSEDYEQATDDYEPVAEEEHPDYVKIDDEEEESPPYVEPDPGKSSVSTEDYDDIGRDEENQDEEDYDDIGCDEENQDEEDYDDVA